MAEKTSEPAFALAVTVVTIDQRWFVHPKVSLAAARIPCFRRTGPLQRITPWSTRQSACFPRCVLVHMSAIWTQAQAWDFPPLGNCSGFHNKERRGRD